MTLLTLLYKVLAKLPHDVLVASHPYGCIVSPSTNPEKYLQDAIQEIVSIQTKRRVVFSVGDIRSPDDILVLRQMPIETLPDCTVLCHIPDVNAISLTSPIFSGYLTSPWTIFILLKGKAKLRSDGAPSARQMLSAMCKNAKSLYKAEPSLLRKRLTAIDNACDRLKHHAWKEVSGYKIKLFPAEHNVDRMKARIGSESKTVMTYPDDAAAVTQLIVSKIPSHQHKKIVVTDATAHVGGNTLSFSKAFKQVNAVEVNPVYFECLQHNINLYKRKNVRCIEGDYIQLMRSLHQDIVFIDPPWGGVGYRMHTRISLQVSNMDLSSIIVSLLSQNTWMIVVKAPLSFDIAKLIGRPPLSTMINNRAIKIDLQSMPNFLIFCVTKV